MKNYIPKAYFCVKTKSSYASRALELKARKVNSFSYHITSSIPIIAMCLRDCGEDEDKIHSVEELIILKELL